MPRTRKGPERIVGNIPSEVMQAAIKRMAEGTKLRQTSREFGISVTTLWRYWKKTKDKTQEEKKSIPFAPNYSVNRVFNDDQERDLKDYLILASKIHHGLTRQETRLLAFELAQKNNLKMPLSWKTHSIAGSDWLKGFRKRWPELSIRKPEATSLARCSSFNRTTVEEFFNNVTTAYNKFADLNASMIYNLDETALTTVHNPPNVLAQKGLKQVGQVTSGERGILVTACCFINAAGNTIPPFLIFPRVNFKTHMLFGAPSGTGGAASKSGWINSEIFTQVLQHFQRHTKCNKNNPVILFMDSHESHIKLEAIDFCRSSGIHVITFPPHTTGKLQPLDRTVYKSLKVNYNLACNDWMVSNPGKTISIYDVASLFGKSYPRAVSHENIISGFRCTGIWPLNRNIFKDDDFLASYVTDRPLEEQKTQSDTLPQATSPNNKKQESPKASTSRCNKNSEKPEEPSEIREQEVTPQKNYGRKIEIVQAGTSRSNHSPQHYFSPLEVRPLQKAENRKNKSNRRRKRSEIITDTPIFNRIMNETAERQKKTRTVDSVKRQIMDSDLSEDKKHQKEEKSSKTVIRRENNYSDSSSEDESVEYEETDDSPEELDDDCNENEILPCQFVLIVENKKSLKTYSVGQIMDVSHNDITVNYYKRIKPYFKFIKTDENFTFDKKDIERFLPKPLHCSGTKRREATFSFSINLEEYKLGLQ